MIASELKAQFEKTPMMSLFDLAQHLKIDPMILKTLLQRWEAKGRVRQMQKTSACQQKCQACLPAMTTLYEYIG